MEYRNLGRSGLKVSSLCLGAMTFGEAHAGSFMHEVGSDAATAFRQVDMALDAGINFVDTADVYGQDGLSERVLGDWFEQSGRRDDVVLATKFRFRMNKGANGSGASRFRIMRCVEDSLRRLKTDRIDLYQIHMQDLDTPEDETLRALDDCIRQGKVQYVGASNYAAYRLMESLKISEALGAERFVSLQAQYSLVVRDLEREHVPLCRRHGLGLLPWSPLARGFLSGKYTKDQAPPPGSRFAKWRERYDALDTPRNWRILEAVMAVSQKHDASPAAVSLAWLLTRPAVTSVIMGARDEDQLAGNIAAASLALDSEDLNALEETSAFDIGYPYDFLKAVANDW